MSSTSITLYIGYARKDCDKSLVTKTFAVILGGDYIEDIYESDKKDSLGKPHKAYKLTFKNTPALQDIADRITREYFIKVAYKLEWDWKTRKYVERYWKVFNYVPYVSPQTAFKPHIMESQPYAELTQDELCSIQKRLSSLYGPEDSKTPDEEDTENDFEELAKAVAHFGEDYPGCIACKFPKLPLSRSDEQEEEIVLKCDQMYDAESEEWNELKAALEVFSGEPITFIREEIPPPPLYTRAENTSHNIC